jgi:hypothetical protein
MADTAKAPMPATSNTPSNLLNGFACEDRATFQVNVSPLMLALGETS